MSTHSVGLALLGCGYWGKNLARCFHSLGALRVLCDGDADRLATVAANCEGVDTTSDWASVLQRDDVQAVAIATPPATHADLISAALDAGKDVYVEKPLTEDLASSEALLAAAAKADRVLMVGHLLRYHAMVEACKEQIDAGLIGRVRYLESRRQNIGKIYTERNVLWNFGPHDATLALLMMAGKKVLSVSASGAGFLDPEVVDAVTVGIHFDDGSLAHLLLSWVSPLKDVRLTVSGSEGALVFDDGKAWEEKLLHFPGYNAEPDGRQGTAALPEPVAIAVEQTEPLLAECRHFVECCESRAMPMTGGEQVHDVQRVLDAAQRSLDSGGQVIEL